MGLFDSEWYRAQVVDADDAGFIVRYIEFGNMEILQANDIMPLPHQFKFDVFALDFSVDSKLVIVLTG